MEIVIGQEEFDRVVARYIEDRLEKQIGLYLQYQLRDVVESRLAALKLTGEKSPVTDEAITARLSEIIDRRLNEIAPAVLSKALAKAFKHGTS